MSALSNLAWLEQLQRELVTRKAVIISGNINDVYPHQGQCRTVPQLLLQSLAQRIGSQEGFQRIVLWDQVSGIQNLVANELEQMVNHAIQQASVHTQGTAAPDTNEPSGVSTDYDFGEVTSNNNSVNTTQSRSSSAQTMNAEDFLRLVAEHMTNPQSSAGAHAFIIDYSHLMFGESRNLTEAEREQLLLLAKALRDAPVAQHSQALQQRHNVVIFICRQAGSLPAQLTTNNAVFGEVSLSLPSRHQRQEFIEQRYDLFQTMPYLEVGSRKFADFVDAQDGFSYRDCLQLAALSRVQQEPLAPEKLVNLYKYGEKSSPWEELNQQKLLGCADELKRRVKGQDEAVESVYHMLLKAYSGLSGIQHSSQQTTPKGIQFFVGPTGVGKTELAKALAKFLFGDDKACLRFDMSEFNHEHSDQRLVGAPPGYVGHEQGGQLTNAVKAKPFSVILFDEVEKAHGKILDKFLQILEDGRLTDGRGQTVSFAESVIIFTSNIGAHKVSANQAPEESAKQFLKEVQRFFSEELKRPELLGRIGNNIVPFNFINDDNFRINIARSKLEPLKQRLKQKYNISGMQFIDEDKALTSICQQTDVRKGGRDILNSIDLHLITPLSRFLVENHNDSFGFDQKELQVIQLGDQCVFTFTLI
ncbi:AAA family ATPase [Vibrio rotiferianus]|uniref:AAA family ATPase n=1 Tax=Vibrio rotiferianus TaxID=190895 RepID=UPI0038B2DC94